ncbi:adenylyl-sulfate kinase [Desulforamulus ruminis]|uniref:adenylyl-sulfate kinase n=1 Tax=Desulforamulus ruminis TaxID=1564 RepID=UPI002FD9CFEB
MTDKNKDTLHFMICGRVDNGKSTLKRLLYESKYTSDNKSTALRCGTKQNIPIDEAYLLFATDRRNYIMDDRPWNEQFKCNMVTGASKNQLAVILIDASKGVLTETRLHSRIVAMMGIRHVVLAINKMDLVGFDEAVFHRIEEDYRNFAVNCYFSSIQAIPLSTLESDNIVTLKHMPWYDGPTLIGYLDTVQVASASSSGIFRMPVQKVNRLDQGLEGFCGCIAEGMVRPGDSIRVLPSGVTSRVKEIIASYDRLDKAQIGDTVTLTLTDEVDVSQGDVISGAGHLPEVADQFQAKLLWLAESPMVPGRPYLLKLHNQEVTTTITRIKYREEINTGAHLAAKNLIFNEIAVVHLSTGQPVVFEPSTVNHSLGGFTLVDKHSFKTVGVGMINFALRRASNIQWQVMEINKQARAALKHQTPCCLWLTGLSGSGKSTIANLLEKRLHRQGKHTYILDGDNVRHGLNRDLGFTEADRVENIRRVAEVAKLMVDAGLIVLVAFISPFRSERRFARELFPEGEFVEIFVDTSIEECEKRDPKGLYAKARRGEIKNFTGIDSVYEPPKSPEIHLCTVGNSPDACTDIVLQYLGEQ